MSVAIPSFIQGISTRKDFSKEGIYNCRNPFFYSGHFNNREEDGGMGENQKSQSLLLFRAFQLMERRVLCICEVEVAIPSFIQGISTRSGARTAWIHEVSQSLLLFRAFQQICQKSHKGGKGMSRNPFFYSGHFNK